MSDQAHSHEEGHAHSPAFYYRIYGILLALLVVSIVGPMLGGLTVLLITAFGVAIVKAVMVASYFMHLNIEKKYITYLILVAVVILVVLFFGLAPDVMNKSGVNWQNIDHTAPPAESAHH